MEEFFNVANVLGTIIVIGIWGYIFYLRNKKNRVEHS